MGDFEKDTRVDRVDGGDGRYTAVPSEDWRIWGPMGGYMASIALRAPAAAEVTPGLLPVTFSCQYFSPARFEEVDIDVTVRRAVKRTAAVAMSISQGGKPVLDAQSWFAAEADNVVHDHAPAPPARSPRRSQADLGVRHRRIAVPVLAELRRQAVDVDRRLGNFPGDKPEWAEWVMFQPQASFEDPVMEACRLVLIVDLPSYPAASRAHPSSS